MSTGLEGTLTFSQGQLKIKDDALATALVETLRIVMREQVNGYALTLLNDMLPTITIRPDCVTFIRHKTTERLIDKLPARLARGLVLTEMRTRLAGPNKSRRSIQPMFLAMFSSNVLSASCDQTWLFQSPW